MQQKACPCLPKVVSGQMDTRLAGCWRSPRICCLEGVPTIQSSQVALEHDAYDCLSHLDVGWPCSLTSSSPARHSRMGSNSYWLFSPSVVLPFLPFSQHCRVLRPLTTIVCLSLFAARSAEARVAVAGWHSSCKAT